jgi:uncharacterized damage-inducible protein DinB
MANQLEVWQRGPIANVPPLLQPVAHALLQANEEIEVLMKDFPDELLWIKPLGMASAGFHLQHLSGVIDRIFTYALSEKLSESQFIDLSEEGKNSGDLLTVALLVNRFNLQVNQAINQLTKTNESTLTNFRSIGRAGLPSTVIGLLFHAAEHTMRHLGQLIVTVKIVKES